MCPCFQASGRVPVCNDSLKRIAAITFVVRARFVPVAYCMTVHTASMKVTPYV